MSFARAFRYSVAVATLLGAHAAGAQTGPEPARGDGAGTGVVETATAAPVDFDGLLAAFATMPGLEATFVEEKHIGLLAAPLVSEGRLYFAPPGHLARIVDTPRPSTVVITPEEVRFNDETGEETIDLGSRPELRALVEAMVWLLAGDADALRGAFEIELTTVPESSGGDGWLLAMVPSGQPLSSLIASMRIEGEGLAVRRIRVSETNGDESITTIETADPTREFSDDEERALFGADLP